MEQMYTVITGCDSGIGASTAKKFAGFGKNLIIGGISKDKLAQVAKEISAESNVKVITLVADFTNQKEIYDFYEATKSFKIETWINNAGVADFGSLMDEDIRKIEEMLAINVDGYTILSTLFLKDYKNVEGTQLLNVGSRVGYDIAETAIIYSATKCFVHGLTEGIYQELQRDEAAKLQAKLMAPNVVKSKFYEKATGMPNADDYLEKFSTSDELASFIWELYNSDSFLGVVNDEFQLELKGTQLGYAENNVTQ